VVDPVEELFQVYIHDDIIAVGDVFPGFTECIVSAPSRAEAKTRDREVGIEQWFQDL
jgi:hypothetical protein